MLSNLAKRVLTTGATTGRRNLSSSFLGEIEVHSKKIINNIGQMPTVEEYLNVLTDQVKTHKGYIDCKHKWKYREMDLNTTNNSKYMVCTISWWESIDDWNNWYCSDDRNDLGKNKMYEDLFESIDHEIYYTKREFPNII